MRFQANPDGTILPQNDIELREARGSLTACWTILRSEIKVNSVHRVFQANFFAIVHKFVEKKKFGQEENLVVTTPKTWSAPAVSNQYEHSKLKILNVI
jgi:hypothetical protein